MSNKLYIHVIYIINMLLLYNLFQQEKHAWPGREIGQRLKQPLDQKCVSNKYMKAWSTLKSPGKYKLKPNEKPMQIHLNG